jgi:hypothetical protein
LSNKFLFFYPNNNRKIITLTSSPFVHSFLYSNGIPSELEVPAGQEKRKKEEALLPWLLELSRTALGGI